MAATLLAGMASKPLSPSLPSPLRLSSNFKFFPSSPDVGSSSFPRQRLRIQAAKKIQGKVVCASNDKTVSVLVTHFVVFNRYKKRVKRSKNYHAHDPDNKCKVGDIVTLEKCAPVSKTKSFMVVETKQGRIQDSLPEEQLLVPFVSN
eukprot:c19493_g1_i1 orf=272-712(+)